MQAVYSKISELEAEEQEHRLVVKVCPNKLLDLSKRLVLYLPNSVVLVSCTTINHFSCETCDQLWCFRLWNPWRLTALVTDSLVGVWWKEPWQRLGPPSKVTVNSCRR
jgi:hypothetical protein